MDANPALGVVLHAIGGLAAASFYIPYKRVKAWSWETYWLVGGVFSWIVAPWAFSLTILPQTVAILRATGGSTLFWTFFFGVLWGVGGLTFGLTMRYLGIALGYAIALGLCAAFGTLMPPLFNGELGDILARGSGQVVVLGVFVCLLGIVVSGRAGIRKEGEVSEADKKAVVAEGECVPGPILEIGNTNSRFRFPIGARAFVNEWSRHGPAHHCAVGLGHVADKVGKLGSLLDMEVARVC